MQHRYINKYFIVNLLICYNINLFIIYFLKVDLKPTLAASSIFVVALFVTASKVYSPQYVLWLSALAVIAIKTKPTLVIFWVWQMAELIYHVAIWQHLALLSNAHFGLSGAFYGAITLLRLAAQIGMIYSLANQVKRAKSAGNTQGKPWDFLFDTASSYP